MALALVELIPEAIQGQVREGKIAAQVAMKFLVPVARQSLEDCQGMAAISPGIHAIAANPAGLYKCGKQEALSTFAQPRWRLRASSAAKFKLERSHLRGLAKGAAHMAVNSNERSSKMKISLWSGHRQESHLFSRLPVR